jgi:hypothetical protein
MMAQVTLLAGAPAQVLQLASAVHHKGCPDAHQQAPRATPLHDAHKVWCWWRCDDDWCTLECGHHLHQVRFST